MGLSGISLGSLLVIFAIAILIFGTKRLGSLGSDLAKAVKGFQQGMSDAGHQDASTTSAANHASVVDSDQMHQNGGDSSPRNHDIK